MKIIFFGSPDFALPTFKSLLYSEHEVIACYSQPPRPSGRGKQLRDTPVAELSKQHGIDVYTPEKLDDKELEKIKSLDADIGVVVAYGLIIPEEILSAPKHGMINLHPSSLPRWRGAAPLQRAIIAGDKTSNVCIVKMTYELDAGDIYAAKEVNISDMTLGMWHDKAALIGADLALDVINDIDNLTPAAQEGEVIYAKKIKKEEAKIDFNQDGESIINLIRGMNPYPGAWFEYKGERIKIFTANFDANKTTDSPGKIDDYLQISCNDGTIIPNQIQKAGKQKVSREEFLRGN